MRHLTFLAILLMSFTLIGQANVSGKITLPFRAPGKTWIVVIDSDYDGDNGIVSYAEGAIGPGLSYEYTITGVASGTYYIYTFVNTVGTMEGVDNGDLVGYYGTGAKPGEQPNAKIPESGEVNFDIELYEWKWDPLFDTHVLDDDFRGASGATIADFNGDGFLDIAGVAKNDEEVSWWQNDGNQNFKKNIIATHFDDAYSIQSGDLDNDGDQDLVTGTFYGNELAWWENSGEGVFTKNLISEYRWVQILFVVDMDGDSLLDILSGSTSESDIIWWKNKGDDGFEKFAITNNLFGLSRIFPSDLNQDGYIDVLATSFISDRIVWFENQINEDFKLHEITDNYGDAFGIGAADLDNDNDIDFVCTGLYEDKVTVFENLGDLNFEARISDDEIDWPKWVHCADINGDSLIDILSGSDIDNYICWYENLGNMEFERRMLQTKFNSPISAISGDLDKDGDLDLIGCADLAGDIFWWENLGDISTSVSDPEELNTEVILLSCFPNPAKATTQIEFQLKRPHPINLSLYTLDGIKIRTVLKGYYVAGWHTAEIDLNTVSPGFYICVIKAGNHRVSRKLLVQ